MGALPRTIKGNLLRKFAKLNVGPVLFSQPSQPVLTPPMRAEGTIDPDGYPRKIGEPFNHGFKEAAKFRTTRERTCRVGFE